MKGNKKYLIAIMFAMILAIYFCWDTLQVRWVEVFKEDAMFYKYYPDHNNEGEWTRYANGNLYVVGHFSDGVKQGWETVFYEDGNIKSRTYLEKGQASGIGYIYDDKGKLVFGGNYRDNARYGSWYTYYANGYIQDYYLYDIYGNIAFSVGYKEYGELIEKTLDGYAVSPNVYSMSLDKKMIPLNRKTRRDLVFKDINDLYILVTNPPRTRMDVTVKINSRAFTIHNVRVNTLRVPGVFRDRNKYKMYIEAKLYNDRNRLIIDNFIRYSIEKS